MFTPIPLSPSNNPQVPPLTTPLPEPLQSFDAAAPALAAHLRHLDTLRDRYQSAQNAGMVLPNSLEAIRVEMTYHSNAIEGNTLTLRETQLVIEGRSPAGNKPLRELYEARNHDRAIRMIEQRAADHLGTPLTEQDLLEVHATVLADIDAQSAGRYRTERVLIKGTRFVPPGAHKFPALIPLILERAARSNVHPATAAAELHYNLVAVHPFNDGNGRTTRLMMNDLLLRHGYPITVIEVERRGEYLAALEDANAGNVAPFASFICSCIEHSALRLLGEQ